MALRVPINPQTRAPSGELGYVRAVDVTAGQRALANVVNKYAEQAADDQRKRELFDVQKMLVDETNNIQLDFDERKNAQPLGAEGFTPLINETYNQRHADMVADLRERGYSEDAVQEFATRLGTIRSQYVAQAIDFQDKSGFAKVGKDTQDAATSLSQYAQNNPLAVKSALAEFREMLTNSNLDPLEQETLYQQNVGQILQGARQGFAHKYPDQVIGLFEPKELAKTSGSIDVGGSEPFNLDSYLQKMGVAEGTAKNPKSSAVGFGQFLKGTWKEYYKKVFGETGESEAQILAKRKNPVIAAKLAERFTGDNIKTLSDAGLPVNETSVYLSHFLGVNDALKVLGAHADSTIEALVDSDSIKANPTVFKKVKTAGDMLEWASKKMGVVQRPDGVIIEQQLVEPVVDPLAPLPLNEEGKSGIDIIDLSNGPERMQMLAWAKQFSAEDNANFRAQVGVTHENAITAAIATGDYKGPKPTEADYVKAYGPVIGPQKLAELNEAIEVGSNIQQFKTLPADQIDARVEALRPKDTASPTYATELAAYTKAREAGAQVKEARAAAPVENLFSTFPTLGKNIAAAKNPQERKAAYSAVNEAYKKLGIPPENRFLLTKVQANKLQEQYASMGPEQKIAQLEEWNNELGELRVPFLRQLNKDGYGAGADSYLWNEFLRGHPNDYSTMSQILAGQKIIKEDPARRPGSDVVNANFKDTFGSALSMLNPSASKMINDAAAAIYVANGGRTDSGQFDLDLYEDSLRKAVGGLAGNDNSGIVDMTQGNVKDYTILPQGETETSFRNWVEQLQPRDLTRLSVEKLPPVYRSGQQAALQDIIDEGVFVAVAPNAYIIKMGSDGLPLKTATGNNFIVRIRPRRLR